MSSSKELGHAFQAKKVGMINKDRKVQIMRDANELGALEWDLQKESFFKKLAEEANKLEYIAGFYILILQKLKKKSQLQHTIPEEANLVIQVSCEKFLIEMTNELVKELKGHTETLISHRGKLRQ